MFVFGFWRGKKQIFIEGSKNILKFIWDGIEMRRVTLSKDIWGHKSLNPPPVSEHSVRENIVADLSLHLVHKPPDLVTKLTTNIVQSTQTPVLNDIQKRALLSIREKVRTQHLVLTEADKGSTMVVLDRAE